MAASEFPLVWEFSRESEDRAFSAGGFLRYPDGTAQELLPLRNETAQYLNLDGVPTAIAFWDNPDMTWDNPHPASTEEQRAFLGEFLARVMDGTYRGLQWGTEYRAKAAGNDIALYVYTASGSSSAIYRYRFRLGNTLYSMYGNTAGTSTIYFGEEQFEMMSEACSGKWFLLLASDGRLVVLHAYYHNFGNSSLEFEWFLFSDSAGLDLYRRSGGISERHAAEAPENAVPEDDAWSEAWIADPAAYTCFSVDHTLRGAWYGAGIQNGDAYGNNGLYFLRYRYEERLDPLLLSGSYHTENGNPVSTTELTLANTGYERFLSEASLFVPGARLSLGVRAGDSDVCPIGTFYLETMDYDVLSARVSVIGKNTIGFRLAEQTFDSDFAFAGSASAAAEAVLSYFGVTDYLVDETTVNGAFCFPAGSSGLDALKTIEDMMSELDDAIVYSMWKTLEMPDGTVLCGYEPFTSGYLPTSEFRARAGQELFSLRVRRSAENMYTKVRADGTDTEGERLSAEFHDVLYPEDWDPGEHRVYHTKTEGVSQTTLAQIAKNNAIMLRDTGDITEMTLNLQPQVLIGDYARITTQDHTSLDVGIVTAICHRFGEDGFFTDITADSGGGLWYFGDRMVTRALPLLQYRKKEELRALLGTTT